MRANLRHCTHVLMKGVIILKKLVCTQNLITTVTLMILIDI